MPLVDCINCGTQTMINGPEDNCQFCGKNATAKKEPEPNEQEEVEVETPSEVIPMPEPEAVKTRLKLGRKPTGEWRKCKDCGKDIYIRKYRLKGSGGRCVDCSRKANPPPVPGSKEKKEEIIVEERKNISEQAVTHIDLTKPVPPRPKKRKQLRKYFEQNKEAIIADYRSMKLVLFYRRWGISTNMWLTLKQDWGILGKHKKHGANLPQGVRANYYVVICNPWDTDRSATEITEVRLSKWLKDGNIKDGDIIYEVVNKRVAKRPVMVLEPA